jgi:hypothetical protein
MGEFLRTLRALTDRIDVPSTRHTAIWLASVPTGVRTTGAEGVSHTIR